MAPYRTRGASGCNLGRTLERTQPSSYAPIWQACSKPHEARLNLIIIDIAVLGSAAHDYGWHELTLKRKNGGESHYTRTRYMEVWNKRANGERPITKYIDNPDRPDTID